VTDTKGRQQPATKPSKDGSEPRSRIRGQVRELGPPPKDYRSRPKTEDGIDYQLSGALMTTLAFSGKGHAKPDTLHALGKARRMEMLRAVEVFHHKAHEHLTSSRSTCVSCGPP